MQGPVTRLIMLDCIMFSAMRTTEGFGAIVEVSRSDLYFKNVTM